MLLTNYSELTMFDLLGSDLEARDILSKRQMRKVWLNIDELDEQSVKGLTHLKKEMVTLIDKVKAPDFVSEP